MEEGQANDGARRVLLAVARVAAARKEGRSERWYQRIWSSWGSMIHGLTTAVFSDGVLKAVGRLLDQRRSRFVRVKDLHVFWTDGGEELPYSHVEKVVRQLKKEGLIRYRRLGTDEISLTDRGWNELAHGGWLRSVNMFERRKQT